ncbi:rhomboid family intramembrane serine protease [Pararcticibacter amylolyticus]|uniref:Rhomboid family intramembrane serine protease n=1 Tax=Pararcticibacter amylolyticus TaxID=2173175 RepID=A0A2U2PA09_9SPHI|nr:rhomboid family intramembrane serine protease [Pararcticibacter amylolyticus]PWG78222.1 rhomboid family intramembrane serine protease [Pararcticibacter amylolyticus]
MEYLNQTPVASAIFIFTLVTSIYAFSNPGIYGKFMLHPYSVSRGQRVYSIFTSGMIHQDWMHLFFNMFSFYFFAFPLERMMGHWQFGILYVASLALSDMSTILKYKDQFGYNSLGASGAISAVVFSYILFNPMATIGVFFIPMNAVVFGILYLVYSAYASRQSSHINHDAHFFGALSGLIITIIFVPGIIPAFLRQLGM